jgi:hypothetical protein
MEARFKEHKAHSENNKTNLSSVVALDGGARLCKHTFGKDNMKLLKAIDRKAI